ncbi:RidA family protein [Nocardiopsis protaetiae]|uniref:RidA family protein n=1 Tax=Nocardiopsis protaetiae TaxID=3382270 RepID=UPI00387B2CCC
MNAGDLVAVSGQIGLVDGRLVDGGAAEQTDRALANLAAVLDAAGLATSDVVKVNIYLTTMDDYTAFNERYNAVFGSEPPARTCVAVHELPFGALVELEAWALRRPAAATGSGEAGGRA